MICPNCNAENPGDALFCSECGSRFSDVAQQPAAPLYGQPDAPQYGQPAPPPSPYGQPTAPPPAYQPTPYQEYTTGYPGPGTPLKPGNASKNWAATTSLILGIISIVCCMFGVGVILAPLSIIFGIMGLKSQKRGLAIAGLICGGVGLVAAIYAIFSVLSTIRTGEFQDLLDQYESAINNL